MNIEGFNGFHGVKYAYTSSTNSFTHGTTVIVKLAYALASYLVPQRYKNEVKCRLRSPKRGKNKKILNL